ncbi:hypothetical protein PAPYR_11370 [Paratrimastix pyriformis]|uniref:Uncharacterized protein n=1 Tax=Paratrimastix pyriformis TaxID=342808 RepID=A0ABQ8U3X0_9EUKA|nr:hypothetical protein PAPYR_11370 [Paratrimastix pyriformis]
MSQLESQPAEGLMDRAFLNWNGNQSYRTRWAPTALHTSEGVADIETPKLDRYIGVWIPSTTHHTTGFRRRPFFRLRVVSSPLMGMEPGLSSPDEPEVSSGATSVSRGLFTPLPRTTGPLPFLTARSLKTSESGDSRTTAFASAADPGRVTNDDGQSCAYAATVQLLAGLRLRARPSRGVASGHTVLETCSEPRRGDFSVREVRSGDIWREHLPAGEQPGPLRVDKCSCGGQLRELSAVKPARCWSSRWTSSRVSLHVRSRRDAWNGRAGRASASSGAEAHWLPTTGHETAIFRTNDGALFDLSGTRTEVTSDVEEGLRLLVLWWRDVTTAATILKAAPGQLRRPPHPVSRPSGTAHPGYSTHLSSTIGPDSTGRPREQLLAPPVDRPASPADVSPSPSDQATTNTPEEEHQDHTGAPLNHNRPRSERDFVIFYPGAARRWTRGPSPSLGHRPAGHRPGGPFELYFPDGAPDGLTLPPPQSEPPVRAKLGGVLPLEDATAARAGASTRGLVEGHGGAAQPPARGDEPTTPQAPSTRAAAATRGATAIRAENETDDEAGTDEAETGPRGATQRRRRARGDPAAEAPRGSH